jgi:hypothetical protein
VKPEAAQFGNGGGLSGKMKASRMPIRAPKARPATSCAELAGAVRSSQSLSVTKASAAFWPWPEKLKPSTPTMLCTSGCLSMKPSTCCITSRARACVAPGGKLHVDQQGALVLVGQEGGGHR